MIPYRYDIPYEPTAFFLHAGCITPLGDALAVLRPRHPLLPYEHPHPPITACASATGHHSYATTYLILRRLITRDNSKPLIRSLYSGWRTISIPLLPAASGPCLPLLDYNHHR